MGIAGLGWARVRAATGVPRHIHVPLCRGTYGDPMGVGVSYERGAPVFGVGPHDVRASSMAGTGFILQNVLIECFR